MSSSFGEVSLQSLIRVRYGDMFGETGVIKIIFLNIIQRFELEENRVLDVS